MRYRKPPACQPRDIGRGDRIRLTPSLFEYQVLTVWLNPFTENAIDTNRAHLLDRTQTVTTNLWCPVEAAGFEMLTSATFAAQRSKDFVPNYFADRYDVRLMLAKSDWHDYRKAALGILDVVSRDSLAMMGWSRVQLSPPILSLSTEIDLSDTPVFQETYVTYMNGTTRRSKALTGPALAYQDVIMNLVTAVVHAIYLDLRSPLPNIFTNPSMINEVFALARPPSNVSLDDWVHETKSWFFGTITPPYQTWAQMVLAGLPKNITLGDLTDWPEDSHMVTDYLCPSYRLKPTSSLLASIFIGTASMFLSAWAAWVVISAFVAEKLRNPCEKCVFTNKRATSCEKHRSEANVQPSLPILPMERRDSTYTDVEKTS
ncbi:hypothetical protein FRC07_001028 [Ceratobasidium sp. 392]|nr:hypothetical protein FRC07_001028 [Ceratobasidium sp. 392]